VNTTQVLEEVQKRQIDALVLPNPNSPTGQRIELSALLGLLDQCRHLRAVVIDESFIEFTASPGRDPTLRPHLDRFPKPHHHPQPGPRTWRFVAAPGLVATSDQAALDEIRRYLPI